MYIRVTFIILLVSLIGSITVQASETDKIIAGGRLYDIWWIDTNLQKPAKNHPAYPAEGHKKNATTWRCKECHGWDYKGKSGAYAKGSHFTGIKGIIDKAGTSTDVIITLLNDNNHRFGELIPANDLAAIALFVSKGQVDMDSYIDPSSKAAKGNSSNGEKVYQENCQRCHGSKGTDLGLANKTGIKAYMGDVSNDNPWETLHKIRFGHPGSKMSMSHMQGGGHSSHEHHHNRYTMGETMPPMYGKLNKEQEADLLSYLQKLPKADSVRIF